MSHFCRPIAGIGYAGGFVAAVAGLMAALGLWYWWLRLHIGRDGQHAEGGSVLLGGNHAIADIGYRRSANWTADDTGLGYEGGALVFGAG